MRGKLFALAVVFLAVALATGTSALSAISSHRTADLHVENDDDAYLQMSPHIGPNGAYAEEDIHGHLAITIDRINSNSTSYFDNVFNITNNGTQPMDVWLADNDTGVGGEDAGNADLSEKNDHPDRVHWYNDANRTDLIEGMNNSVRLEVGETLQVGVRTNTYPVMSNGEPINESTNLVEQIHINAEKAKLECSILEESTLWAQNVKDSRAGTDADPPRDNPQNVLGPNDDDFFSLDQDGYVEVGFGKSVCNAEEIHVQSYETTFNRENYHEEQANVYINNLFVGTASNKDLNGVSTFNVPNSINSIHSIKIKDTEGDISGDGYDINSIALSQ